MKRITIPFVVLVIFLFAVELGLMACAPVSANYPQKRPAKKAMEYDFGFVLFQNNNLKIVRKSSDTWFSPKIFDNKIKEQVNKMVDRGLSPSEVERMIKKRLKTHNSMELLMKESSGGFAYLGLGLVFEKNMKFLISKGAFVVKLKSPTGSKVEIVDLGLLMKVQKEERNSYLDSDNKKIMVNWGLQKPDYSKGPNLVKLRLPKEYTGWSVESVSIKPERLVVVE